MQTAAVRRLLGDILTDAPLWMGQFLGVSSPTAWSQGPRGSHGEYQGQEWPVRGVPCMSLWCGRRWQPEAERPLPRVCPACGWP